MNLDECLHSASLAYTDISLDTSGRDKRLLKEKYYLKQASPGAYFAPHIFIGCTHLCFFSSSFCFSCLFSLGSGGDCCLIVLFFFSIFFSQLTLYGSNFMFLHRFLSLNGLVESG